MQIIFSQSFFFVFLCQATFLFKYCFFLQMSSLALEPGLYVLQANNRFRTCIPVNKLKIFCKNKTNEEQSHSQLNRLLSNRDCSCHSAISGCPSYDMSLHSFPLSVDSVAFILLQNFFFLYKTFCCFKFCFSLVFFLQEKEDVVATMGAWKC